MFHQQLPLVTTDPNKLEAQAKSILKPTAFNYVAGGAGERATMDANRLAFRQWKMVPRMLSGWSAVQTRDTKADLAQDQQQSAI